MAPIKHNNAKKTDEEILNLIQFHENKYTKVSDLLHFFIMNLKSLAKKNASKHFIEILRGSQMPDTLIKVRALKTVQGEMNIFIFHQWTRYF